MADSLVDNYKSQHQHPLNKLCHMIGIPMIALALPVIPMRHGMDGPILRGPFLEFLLERRRDFIERHERVAAMLAN